MLVVSHHRFSASDTGIGIPEHDLEAVFERSEAGLRDASRDRPTRNFFTTWRTLSVLTFASMMVMSGTLFRRYYDRPSFETWQRKPNPVYPKPAVVRWRVLQILKGVYTAALYPAIALHLVDSGWSMAYAGLGGFSVGYLVFTFLVVWIGSDFYEFAYHRLGHKSGF